MARTGKFGGGALSVVGSQDQVVPVMRLLIKVEGVDRTTAEFKQIRKEINAALRDAQEAVGQRHVLPLIKARFPRKDASVKRGLPVGAMANSLYVKRDRLDVFIGSRLKLRENRALGWVDFGAPFPRRGSGEHNGRRGPQVILTTLVERQDVIRAHIQDAVMAQFARKFDVD